ncbi:MAG: hypothetical protein ACYC9S_03010 [Leptospirales bacterium]
MRQMRIGKNWKLRWIGGMLLLAGALSITACEDTPEITPMQKKLFSAWNIARKMRVDYQKKDADKVISLLTPELAQKYDVRKKLDELFLGLATTSLHLELDQGIWETKSNRIDYKAHWTFSGMVKKGGPRVFKTGECRIWVILGTTGEPSRIQRIVGDNFLLMALPPGKISQNPGPG